MQHVPCLDIVLLGWWLADCLLARRAQFSCWQALTLDACILSARPTFHLKCWSIRHVLIWELCVLTRKNNPPWSRNMLTDISRYCFNEEVDYRKQVVLCLCSACCVGNCQFSVVDICEIKVAYCCKEKPLCVNPAAHWLMNGSADVEINGYREQTDIGPLSWEVQSIKWWMWDHSVQSLLPEFISLLHGLEKTNINKKGYFCSQKLSDGGIWPLASLPTTFPAANLTMLSN